MAKNKRQPEDAVSADAVTKIDKLIDDLGDELKDHLLQMLNDGLPDGEIETVFDGALYETLARRKSQHGSAALSLEESELFEIVNRSLGSAKSGKLDQLLANRESGALSPDDQSELVALNEEQSKLHVARLQAADKLARIRALSFEEMCDQLDLITAPNG